MRTGWIAGMVLVGSVAFAQGQGKTGEAPGKTGEAPGKAKAGSPAMDKGAKAGGAAMEMPKPPAELEVEKWFEGKWKCDVTQHASPMGPEGKATNALVIKMDIQGWWLNFHVDREKGAMPGAQVAGFAGYDASMKKHVRTDFSFGGGMTNFTSPGWEGDKLTFTGDTMMMGKKMAAKHTFTKKGDTEFTTVFEMAGPDGKLMTVAEEDCKKGGKK